MKATEIIKKFSNKQLLFLEGIAPEKYAEVLAGIRLKKYISETDFDELSMQNRKICIIDKGEWDYPLFQISFLNNMLANIIDCLSRGYMPVVDFKNTKDGINLWEQFLKQSFLEDSKQKIGDAVIYEKKRASLWFPVIPSKKDVEIISKMIKRVVRMNDTTKTYVEREYNDIIKGKKVLGVLCRGTDYTSNKPKGHPIQPPIEDVICHVRTKLQELEWEYIYLATEEKQILDQFTAAFPDKILTNKRFYYDDFYVIKERYGDLARISHVSNGRENDNYYKSLEYLSSIYILSKCDSLIAGNCGGSRAALYLNGNDYQYSYLFDYGLY